MAEEVEYYDDIDVFWLKKHGYFCGLKSGGIKWIHQMSGRETSVGFQVSVSEDYGNYVRFLYKITNRHTNEVENFDYKVQLTTTSCNLGGVRYWFICPLVQNGQSCGRRVAKLYMGDRYFGCRKCYALVYSSQTIKWSLLQIPSYKTIYLDSRLRRKYRELGRKRFHRGGPTKKYYSILKIENELRYHLRRGRGI